MEDKVKKEIGLVIANVVISAVLFGYLLLGSGILPFPGSVVVVVLGSLIWVALLAVAIGLVPRRSSLLLSFVIPLLVVFFGKATIEAWGAALVLGLLMIIARWEIRRELETRKKFRTKGVFGPGVKLLVMGLVVVIAGLGITRLTKTLQSERIIIPEESVRIMLYTIDPLIKGSALNISTNKSVEEMINEQIDEQAADLGQVNPTLLEKQKKVAINELSKQLNQDVKPEDDLAIIVTRAINHNILKLANDQPLISSLAVMIIILLFARIITPLYAVPVVGLVAVVIHFGKEMDLFYIQIANEPVEKLVL